MRIFYDPEDVQRNLNQVLNQNLKQNIMKLSVQIFSMLFALLFFASCGGGGKENSTDGGGNNNEIGKTSLGEAATVNTPSGLTMRAEPKTDGEQVTLVPNKEAVTILDKNGPGATIGGKSGSWYKVKYKDKEGYVFSAFLSMGAADSSKSNDETDKKEAFDPDKYTLPESESQAIVAARSGVKLRSTGSTDGEEVIVAPYDAKLDIIEFNQTGNECIGGRIGSWYKVKYKGKEGYVFNAFIRTYNGLRNPMYMQVKTKSGVILRDQPTTQGEKIISAPSDANVEVVDECAMMDQSKSLEIEGKLGFWIKVKYKGKTGYAFSGFLQYYISANH